MALNVTGEWIIMLQFQVLWCLSWLVLVSVEELPEFVCMDGSTMDFKSVCDGKIDCSDGTDETKELCYHIICPKRNYRCHYGACIPLAARCNGKYDCADKSDESQCGRSSKSCDVKEFRCVDSGECVKLNLICDGNMDCNDGSDESHDICEDFPCPHDSYHCRHGGCVHLDARCDGNPDCIDGSDESDTLCSSLKCDSCKSNITCPAIISSRLSTVCEHKAKGIVSCEKPVPVGTKAKYECKSYFKPTDRKQSNNTQTICQPDGTWSRNILKCEPDCGKSEKSMVPLIVKGSLAEVGRFPWHTILYALEDGQYAFRCGGSLISELVVVTAGHCVWKTPVRTLRIAVGKHNNNISSENENTQIRDIRNVIIQPSYQDQMGNYGSDLAVMILSEPVEFNVYIRPVCIDWNLYDITDHLAQNSLGTLVGLGVTENDTFSERLQTVQLPVVNDEECLKAQKRDFRKYVTYTAFCAGWRNGTGACNGDSGGGLVFPKRNNSRTMVLQGVVSISPRRLGTSFCDPKYLTVFTKVGMYTTWLQAVLNTIHPEIYRYHKTSLPITN